MGVRKPGPNELRDHLANERTFLAWMRTSITIVGLGFVVAKFGILLREVSLGNRGGAAHVHPLTERAGAVVGIALVVSGVLAAAFATANFLRIRRDIERNVVNFDPRLGLALAVLIAVIGVILAGYLVVTA